MADVTIVIAGRGYTLACRDGDEARVHELASDIAVRADRLTQTLGTMSEARLLLMSALMIADELSDVRQGRLPLWTPPPAEPDSRLTALADQAEQLVARLSVGGAG